jgi:hypothetical protein
VKRQGVNLHLRANLKMGRNFAAQGVAVLGFLLSASAPHALEPVGKRPSGSVKYSVFHVRYELQASGTYNQDVDLSIELLDKQGEASARHWPVEFTPPGTDAGARETKMRTAYTLKRDGRRVDAVELPRDKSPVQSSFVPMVVPSHLLDFPDAEVGDVLVMSYRVERTAAEYPGNLVIDQYFSRAVEYDDASVQFTAPSSLQLRFEPNQLTEAAPTDDGKTRTRTWTFRNVNPVALEPNRPPDMAAMPRIHVSSFANVADEQLAVGARMRDIASKRAAAMSKLAGGPGPGLAAAGFRGPEIPALPMLPHETTPDAWPQPDYVAETLKLTDFKPDGQSTELGLRRGAGQPDPDVVVLPVQTQAFGFSPPFRAIVGAFLDRELHQRGIGANSQVEISGVFGPFVRRLNDVAVDALASRYPRSRILLLYLGQDGDATAFVTLVSRAQGKVMRAHRSIALPAEPEKALEAVDKTVAQLLSELGLLAVGGKVESSKLPAQCSASAWQLADDSRAMEMGAQACRAFIVGSLLPTYGITGDRDPMTPQKLANLAQAYAWSDASTLAASSADAIRNLAWRQLQLPAPAVDMSGFAQSSDPVVSPIARLLAASQVMTPLRSPVEARKKYLASAVEGKPDFVRAVFLERARFYDSFARVDMCALESVFPESIFQPRCPEEESVALKPVGRRASLDEAALYAEWVVASYYKDLLYLGKTLGTPERLHALLKEMPRNVLAHPIIGRMRYYATMSDPATGSFDQLLDRTRASDVNFVQSTVDLQWYDSWLGGWSLTEHDSLGSNALLSDREISNARDAEFRLIAALKYDRFNTTLPAVFEPSRRKKGEPAPFLSKMPYLSALAVAQAAAREQKGTAPPGAPPNVAGSGVQPLFPAHEPLAEAASKSTLESNIDKNPADMRSRVELAILALKDGASMEAARSVIDAQPVDDRVDGWQVGATNLWSMPAEALSYAGETGVAGEYFRKVERIGTGSEADMHAQVRLRTLAGDIPGAIAAAQQRLSRYENDGSRSDLAGLLFMDSKPEDAWNALRPRLAVGDHTALWLSALVGQRMAGNTLPGVKDWLDHNAYGKVDINFDSAEGIFLQMYAIIDRLPGDADIGLLADAGKPGRSVGDGWGTAARLAQMSLKQDYDPAKFEKVRSGVALSVNNYRFMMPLFAWVAWHATNAQDPELAIIRTATRSWDFDSVLAKSMVLALDGKRRESLEFLRVARYEMSRIALLNYGWNRIDERPVPPAYQFALSAYLMYRETADDAYRTEALTVVRDYQKTYPYWAWLYAIEAALESDQRARIGPACRAALLDPASYFLHLSGVSVDSGSAQCRPPGKTDKPGS